MSDVLPLLVVVALVAAASLVLRRRSGLASPDGYSFTPAEMIAIGLEPTRPAFVVFTAPGCSTCGPARALVEEVAARVGVAVAVVDAARQEALAAAHHVLRAPTTFVVIPGGRIAGRIVGVPRASELVHLIGETAVHGVDTAA